MFTRIAVAAAALVVCVQYAAATGIPQPGDFYFISRDKHGDFRGSHKLYLEYSADLRKVSYCGRFYYVRSQSVAWTQSEAESGHTVQIEYNFGKGWRPICGQPQRQVTLADLGIDMSPEDFLAAENTEDKPVSRLSAISSRFNKTSNGDRDASFHTR